MFELAKLFEEWEFLWIHSDGESQDIAFKKMIKLIKNN